MKTIHAAILVVSAVVLLALAPAMPVANAAKGFGAHSSHSSHFSGHGLFSNQGLSTHRHQARPNGNFSQWPLFGGYYAVPPYASDNIITYVTPERVVFVAVPPRALSCHRSVEKVTVPAEAGGTRDITITRC
jgi:hypothetical protein